MDEHLHFLDGFYMFLLILLVVLIVDFNDFDIGFEWLFSGF